MIDWLSVHPGDGADGMGALVSRDSCLRLLGFRHHEGCEKIINSK